MTTPIFDYSNPKNFNQFLVNLYQYVKKPRNISFFYFEDIVDSKSLQSNWPGAFGPISQEPNFSQIWDIWGVVNNVNVHYRTNSEILAAKFFDKFKKLYLGPIFSISGEQFFLKKIRLYYAQFHTQPAFTCSKLTKETLEQGVKYVQS